MNNKGANQSVWMCRLILTIVCLLMLKAYFLMTQDIGVVWSMIYWFMVSIGCNHMGSYMSENCVWCLLDLKEHSVPVECTFISLYCIVKMIKIIAK